MTTDPTTLDGLQNELDVLSECSERHPGYTTLCTNDDEERRHTGLLKALYTIAFHLAELTEQVAWFNQHTEQSHREP